MPEPPPVEQPNRQPTPSPSRLWLGLLAIAYLTICTFPGVYDPLGPPSIDPGWRWAVNQAFAAGLIFGRDVVFTYGPLAYLMVPMDVGSNLLVANCFSAFVHLLVMVSLGWHHWRTRRLAALLLATIMLVTASRHGLSQESMLVLGLGWIVYLAVAHINLPALATASILTGVFLLIKSSLGLAAATMLIAAFVLLAQQRHLAKILLLGIVPGTATFLALAAVFFRSPGNLLAWIDRAFQVVSGYSTANSILGPHSQLAVGLSILVTWALAAFLTRHHAQLRALNLIFIVAVPIQFRIAFVRQDSHQLQFLPFVIGFLALTALAAGNRRHLLVIALATLLIMAVGTPVGLLQPGTRDLLPIDPDAVSGGVGRVSKLVRINKTRRELAIESEHNLRPLALPSPWLEPLRASTNGVGTLPWEIQYCPANNLEWNPTPTLQLYSTYTQRLDLWSADHYAGDSAPGFILNEYVPVGKRHQMLDAPATWRSVFINYRPRAALDRPQLALLERRQRPLEVSLEEIGHQEIDLGRSGFVVPPSPHLLFAAIDLRPSSLGRLQKTLFRVPLVLLVLHHTSGQVTYYRLIPDTARNGVLINRFPKDFMAYLKLWTAIEDDPVVRFTISGPGLPSFRRRASLRWLELRPSGNDEAP